MIEINNSPELCILQGYSSALSDFLSHTDYCAGVDVQGFIVSDAQFVLKEVLKCAFPYWNRDEKAARISSVSEFIETIGKCLNFDLAFYLDKEFSERSRYKVNDLNEEVNLGFLSVVKKYIDYERSEIYLCPDSIGVMWSFTFIIYDKNTGRCLVLDGAADD